MTPIEQAIVKVLTGESIHSSVNVWTYDVGSGDTVTGQDVDWQKVAASLADQLREAYEEATT